MSNEFPHGARSMRKIRPTRELDRAELMNVFGLYAVMGVTASVGMPWLAVLPFFVLTVRLFNVRHERAHAAVEDRGFVSKLISFFSYYHTPYQEPFSAKRAKHLAHHFAHTRPDSRMAASSKTNPHRLFETNPWWRAALATLFYEEVMAYWELRAGTIWTRERLATLIISSAVLMASYLVLGWQMTLTYALIYRVGAALAWFSFSYVLHLPRLYGTHALSWLRPLHKRIFDFVLGSGASTGVIFHRFHHDRPRDFLVY